MRREIYTQHALSDTILATRAGGGLVRIIRVRFWKEKIKVYNLLGKVLNKFKNIDYEFMLENY